MPKRTFVSLLEQRVRAQPGAPLLTWYDPAQGARVELSAATFANWVDKTVNLLISMDVAERPRVINRLLVSDPLHWTSLVWTAATWQLAGVVLTSSDVDSQTDADAAVVGPYAPFPVPGVETVACSLHPLGLGFPDRHPGVTDYQEVLAQPDVHWAVPAPESAAPCFENTSTHTWAHLDDVAPSRRRLVFTGQAGDWDYLTAALVAPVAGGGSSVLVSGRCDRQQLEAIMSQERAELA